MSLPNLESLLGLVAADRGGQAWEQYVASLAVAAPGVSVALKTYVADSDVHVLAQTRHAAPGNVRKTAKRKTIQVGHEAYKIRHRVELQVSNDGSTEKVWRALEGYLTENEAQIKAALLIQLLQTTTAQTLQSCYGLLEAIEKPAILINANMQVFRSNHAARRLIEKKRCFKLDNYDRLVLCDPESQGDLRRRLTDMPAAAGAPRVLRFMGYDGNEHSLKAIPVRFASCLETSGASKVETAAIHLLTIQQFGELPNVQPELISESFGMSVATAKLVAALACGSSLQEYCEATGIKIATGRWHLNRAFQATDTKKQPELISRVLRGVL